MITVGPGDPRAPQATALLKQSHALMQELFPAESNHFLGIDALCASGVHFFTASEGDRILGTGALAEKGHYGEVKSMFTDPDARGKGVADKVLHAIVDKAHEIGLSELKLETGDLLKAAHKLYEKHGFTYCGPFGDYPEDPNSLFMTKSLAVA